MKYPDVTAPRERSGLHGADTAVTKGTQSLIKIQFQRERMKKRPKVV